MDAAQARTITEGVDMRAVFEASCQKLYSGTMAAVEAKARLGQGGCRFYLGGSEAGVLEAARDEVVVALLRRAGYLVEQNPTTESYFLTWHTSRAPWEPERDAENRPSRWIREAAERLFKRQPPGPDPDGRGDPDRDGGP